MATLLKRLPNWLLITLVLHSVAVSPTRAGEILVDEFETTADWTGLVDEHQNVQQGLGAGLWADTVNRTSIRKTFVQSLDLSSFSHLGFWLHSEVANGAQFQLVLDSEDPDSAGWDYYSVELVIDWSGWRWVWLPLPEFGASRHPLGWQSINYLSLNASGWSHEPLADTRLVFDHMVFAQSLVEQVDQQQGWQGDDFVYTFDLHLRNIGAQSVTAEITCDVPDGLVAAVRPPTVDLTSMGQSNVSVTVTIPTMVIAGGAYRQFTVGFASIANASAREEWQQIVASPGALREHPRLLLNAEDFVRIHSWGETNAWAAKEKGDVLARADDWPSGFARKYGLSQWEFPPDVGQWGSHYVCPTHGVNLRYEPPMTHRCPVDNASIVGAVYDQVIYGRQHNDLAKAARYAGLAYQLTGDTQYAEVAREVLLGYAARYGSYPIHNTTGVESKSGARVLAQTLDESGWLIQIAWAYDLISGSGSLSSEEERVVEADLLRACANIIRRNDAGASNWQSWHNTAIAAAGCVIGDPSLVAEAVYGSSGFHYQMGISVEADGFWYEGSWSYHLYTLSAMAYLAEMGERNDFPLYDHPALRGMFESPVLFAQPDLTLPAFNDSGTARLSGSWQFEGAYERYQDPTIAVPLSGSGRGESGLFWGVANVPEQALRSAGSQLFEASGFAVLRGGTETDPWYLALDYGPHGGWHGHYDKLGFVLYAKGETLGLDPGSHSYALPLHGSWDRSTVAHNTVVVDETRQAETTGRLHRFVDLPGCVLVRASAGAAYQEADLTRNLVMMDGYVIDRMEARGLDGLSHRYDWVYHNPAPLSHSLNTTAYAGLPDSDGYAHLTENQAATTTDDAWFDFRFATDLGYPGSIWASAAGIVSDSRYTRDAAHAGRWSNELSYDFSGVDDGSYITYRTQSMARFGDQVPVEAGVWVNGKASGNRLRLRIIDATGESHVSPWTDLDFLGWWEVREAISGWSHWSGDEDGVIDLPLSELVVEIRKEAGGTAVGRLQVDDWRLWFPGGGEVVAEDFEVQLAAERLQILGGPETTFVVGQGVGPDLTKPVPYVMARREAVDVDFEALHEPFSDTPAIVKFEPTPTDAVAGDAARGYRITSDTYEDRILVVGEGESGSPRSFEGMVSDGVLAWVRHSSAEEWQRLALAEGTFINDGSADLLTTPAPLKAVAFQRSGAQVAVLACSGSSAGLRLYAPGVNAVQWQGRAVPFTQDGDWIVLGMLPFLDEDDDTLPDVWENEIFEDLSRDGAGDEDEDLSLNHEEYIWGTRPDDHDSRAWLRVRQAGEQLELSWDVRAAEGPGYAGLTRHCLLESSQLPGPGAWKPVDEDADSTVVFSGEREVQIPRSNQAEFFRLRVWLR